MRSSRTTSRFWSAKIQISIRRERAPLFAIRVQMDWRWLEILDNTTEEVSEALYKYSSHWACRTLPESTAAASLAILFNTDLTKQAYTIVSP